MVETSKMTLVLLRDLIKGAYSTLLKPATAWGEALHGASCHTSLPKKNSGYVTTYLIKTYKIVHGKTLKTRIQKVHTNLMGGGGWGRPLFFKGGCNPQ